MQKPLQITFRNMKPSEAVEARIQKNVARLERSCDILLGCHVVVEAPRASQQKGGLYYTRIELSLPEENIAVNRAPDLHMGSTDVYVSIRDAFAAARRQLQKRNRRRQGLVKTHAPRPRGRITAIFPEMDSGRIATAAGEDVYFHRNSILNADFDALQVGTPVSFAQEQGNEGPQASSVRVLKRGGGTTPAS